MDFIKSIGGMFDKQTTRLKSKKSKSKNMNAKLSSLISAVRKIKTRSVISRSKTRTRRMY